MLLGFCTALSESDFMISIRPSARICVRGWFLIKNLFFFQYSVTFFTYRIKYIGLRMFLKSNAEPILQIKQENIELFLCANNITSRFRLNFQKKYFYTLYRHLFIRISPANLQVKTSIYTSTFMSSVFV